MSTDSENHIEARELLPWYVNNTLDVDQEKMVHEHLAACTECRVDYAFLCNIDSAVNKASPAPIVPQPPIETFMARIDAEKKVSRVRDHRALWVVAASLITAIMLTVIFRGAGTAVTGIPTRFETATSASTTVSMDYVLRIRFEDGMTMGERAAIIESFDGQSIIADGDSYRVTVSIPAPTLEAAEDFTAAIKARPEVRSVEIVALQLPVRNE